MLKNIKNLFLNLKSNITYYFLFKNFYIIKYRNSLSLLLIICFSFLFSPQATLLEGDISEAKPSNLTKNIINTIIIVGGLVILGAFLKENVFNQAPNINIPSTSQQDLAIRKEVESCLNEMLETIIKSLEINENSAAIGVAVASASTINVIQEVAPTVQLPITLPIEASKIPELVINSKKFYQFFFDQLDFSSTSNYIPSNLPDLGESFKRQKQLLDQYVLDYKYSPNTVKKFAQEVISRTASLYHADINLLCKYYLHHAYSIYAKSQQFNLMSFQDKSILDLTVHATGCTFSIPDLLKQYALVSFFGLTRFFLIFYHPNIGNGHFSGHIVYNMLGFKESDYGRPVYKEGQKARINIGSLPLAKEAHIYPKRFKYLD